MRLCGMCGHSITRLESRFVWNDYKMYVAPYEKGKPIYYEFTECLVEEFARKYDLLEVMPALCNPDYKAICGHLCRYCYANANAELVRENMKRHDPKSPFLLGRSMPEDVIHEAKQKSWIDGQMTLDQYLDESI